MAHPELNLPSPLQKIYPSGFEDINLYIKRDDLIHTHISGNKWRKLQKTVVNFNTNKYDKIVTFGGAFSNHLVATAVACSLHGINCSAYVRTDSIDLQNPTLALCLKYGMKLFPLDRNTYSKKRDDDFLAALHETNPRSLLIPEGGFHPNAIEGLSEMMAEIHSKINPDLFVVSLGTGCTASGVVQYRKDSQVWISPAIKQFTSAAIVKAHHSIYKSNFPKDQVKIIYHKEDRAYAKKDLQLFLEVESFLKETGILLDPIYTSKAWRMLKSKISNIEKGSNVVLIHTGGLQAWKGYFYRFPALKDQLPEIFKIMANEV